MGGNSVNCDRISKICTLGHTCSRDRIRILKGLEALNDELNPSES